MSTSDYTLFEEGTKLLARTLTIGHKMVAESINNYLLDNGYPVSDYPEEWKYYLNLNGEYHQSDYDYIATVNADGSPHIRIRLGGLSGSYYVDLTKELIHGVNSDPAIAVEYRFGSRGYNNLVAQYPRAIELIRGILYPIDKDVAINVEDGSILQIGGYIRNFVNGNPEKYYFQKADIHTVVNFDMIDGREIGLINDLEVWIRNYFDRWLVRDYVFFNEYYIPTLLGLLQAILPAKIATMRQQRIGTSEVHTFHVKQRLNDVGGLGQYVDIIPENVYMWLYRNADYLDHARGRTDTLDKLITNVLEPLGIPANAYRVSTNVLKTKNQLATAEISMRPLNKTRNRLLLKRAEIDDTLEKEIDLAPENRRDISYDLEEIHEDVLSAAKSNYPTKLVESQWVIYTPDTPIDFEDFLISYWVYNSAKGNIGGFIFIHDPVNGEAVPMSNEAALYLALWLYAKGFHDYTIETIPSFGAMILPKAKHFNIPGQDGYPAITSLYNQYRKQIPYSTVEELVGDVLPKYSYSNTLSFFTDAKLLYKDLTRRYLIWSCQYSPYDRAFIKRMNADLYWRRVDVAPSRAGLDYNEFLLGLGISVQNASSETCRDLFYEVIKKATGNTEMTADQHRALHDALISIVKHFMSYPIQLIHSTLIGDLDVKNEAVIRSFIEDRFAEYLINNPLPRINHTTTPFRSTYDGVRDPTVSDIVANDHPTGILSSARLFEGSWNERPKRTVATKYSGMQTGIVNANAKHIVNKSSIRNEIIEEQE